MSLFQKSVIQKYLNDLDPELINSKYAQYQSYFGDPVRQENIRNSKEEQFQEGFLRELFVNVLGYTLNPDPDYNLTTELKNIANSKKADGAILKGKEAIAVIELKGTDTTDLDKIETQAFGYKNHHPKCVYVITSNFEKLRFYIQNAVDHIDFNLFNLSHDDFSLMWLCLASNNLLNNIPLKINDSSLLQEENITKQLYADYSKFREEIYNNLVKNNPEKDKLLLFKKTQKLLDRFLFIFFAEDRLLLPPNSISEIVKQWTVLKEELDEYVPLYSRFKKYFGYMDKGHKGKRYDIFAYNGGLFAPDEILDNISIDDEILHKHTLRLSQYDYQTDVDVNILGHIFEHSLGEIENVQAAIKGEKIDAQKTKRKKDGIFYTPKYITKYIVENTVGKLCLEKRAELGIVDEEYAKGRKNRKKEMVKLLDKKLDDYRNWLLSLTILDPACGSGAFLNQALDFLITEHRKVDNLRAQLLGGSIVFPDITTDILEKNIYGVDLNEESVDIAKLSLWLRTAQKGRKLNALNNNIKCGNSLIDDPEVAGEKAFKWEDEFPLVFKKKSKKIWHVTTATHNSRYSQRMFQNQVKLGEAEWIDENDELIVTETIKDIALSDKLNILEYNICGDHMHLLLACTREELPEIVGKLKSVSAKNRNRQRNRPNGV
jgi:REP element-mobilizing transposase RayT